MLELYLSSAAIILVVVCFCIQFGMFVRPVELEKKHREIMDEVASKYVNIGVMDGFREELKDMKCKLEQIYNILLKRKVE